MTATQKVTILKNAGFTNKEIIQMVKANEIDQFVELAEGN